MPSAVTSLLASVGLQPGGCVSWKTPVPETAAGVYMVALTSVADEVECTHADPPVNDAALGELIAVCPGLSLDGAPGPTRDQIRARISRYWLPDECVLYIGLAGQPLRKRVRQYYRTPLGAARPHAGGWWLKTLAVLDQLFVHYAATENFKDAEEAMLRAFARNVSDTSRDALAAGEPVMPFANLRDGDWRRRNHGISGATGAPQAAKPGAPRHSPRVKPASTVIPMSTPHRRSQNITAKDIEAGRVRVPGETKSVLPSEREYIAVALRGRELTCRWDPRDGPPARSGVILVGKAAAAELLVPGDILRVSVRDDGVVSLD